MPRFIKIFWILSCVFPILLDSLTPASFTVLSGGNPAGFQTVNQISQTEFDVSYEYNDRGRGPKLSSRISLNSKGVPTAINNTGVNYYKATVNETFKVDGTKANWQNEAEQGSKEFQGNEFYVSQTGVPLEIALLAKALLAAPERKLTLLPEGEAQIEPSGELEVEGNGSKTKITQYAISGLDFVPSAIWLDADQNFFALGGSFLFIVRKGFESSQDAIIKAQEDAQTARLAGLAKRLGEKPKGALMIRNASLFDSETAEVKKGQSILIEGNRIRAIGVDAELKAPFVTKVIDATGKFVMPGLWDMHVHLGSPDGLLHLAAGVTGVRDLANDTEKLIETRRKFDAGELIGPRIVMAGFIDGPGPYAGPSKVLVDNEQQARAEVDRYAKLGCIQIKLYSSLKPELVAPIVDQARKHGMRVSGHIPAFMTAEQAVNAGYNEIQHANMLFLNFLFDIAKDTRTPLRFTAVAEHAAEMDFNSEKWQSFFKLLKDKNITIDPTVSTFEEILVAKPGEPLAAYKELLPRLPPQVRRQFLAGGLPIPAGKEKLYQDSYRKMVDLVGELYKHNITIVAGTDSYPGFTLHRELEQYVDAGIPAAKVLQIATLTAAQIARQDKELGSITKHKLADLIIIDGDPTRNINDVKKVETVIKDGVIYRASDLYRAVGVKP
ncbi:MAG TPA: amidohydrolase family protein [Acidobacteriota bacterium]|nr:amidohydrolase family protein [Acidobacteriota bacterium]